jgi:hypothetical protein
VLDVQHVAMLGLDDDGQQVKLALGYWQQRDQCLTT